jgi:hypothetical protein
VATLTLFVQKQDDKLGDDMTDAINLRHKINILYLHYLLFKTFFFLGIVGVGIAIAMA